MSVVNLQLDKIRLDGDTQPRVELDDAIIGEYAEQMAARAANGLPQEFPPLDVFHDGKCYWLGGGFHRWHAARKAGLKDFKCNVHQGSVEDARWFAVATNKTHGLRRTNADKRRAVEMALKARPELSNVALAEHCGVDRDTIAEARKRLAESASQTARTGRDGRTTNTANIGKTQQKKADKPADKPAEEPTPAMPPDKLADARKLLIARPSLSDAAIAAQCGVPSQVVAAMRAEMASEAGEDSPADDEERAGEKEIREAIDGDPDLSDEVIAEALGTTPELVAAVRAETLADDEDEPEEPVEVLRDRVGIPVPEAMREMWLDIENRRRELKLHLRRAAQVLNDLCPQPGAEHLSRCVGLKVRGERHHYQSAHLEGLLSDLRYNLPFACACPYCHQDKPGSSDKKCNACRGLGWVAERAWKSAPEGHRRKTLADLGADDTDDLSDCTEDEL